MERRVAFAAVVVLAAGALVVGARSDPGAPDPAPEPPPPSSTPGTTPTTETEAGPRPALLAPTGVPLEILSQVGDRWLVRTPCDRLAAVTGEPIGPFRVVLDPGHGGPVDTGAVGANGLVESDVNLQVASAAAQDLAARGITVLLTRNDDYAITLPTRISLAEAVGAEALVSIHHNAPRVQASSTPGTEMFVQSGAPDSIRLGGLLQDRVVATLSTFDVNWVSASDAGVLQVRNPEGEDAYGMVRRPRMPAVLAELGYLANPPEAELFATPAYVEAAGLAIADAVAAFLGSDVTGAPLRAAGRVRDPAASAATRDCVDPPLE